MSFALISLVPFGVVTLTWTLRLPTTQAGVVTVMEVDVLAVIVPGTLLNLTAEALSKLVPVTVMLVPPAIGPLFGESEVTVGKTPEVQSERTTDAVWPAGAVSVNVPLPAVAKKEPP